MKVRNTQKLFWKQWPYKAVVEIRPSIRMSEWRRTTHEERKQRQQDFEIIERWCKSRFPEAGIRKESHLSIFLSSQEELDTLIDHFGHRILEVWKPINDTAKEMLLAHSYDIVRAKPWYNKYPIRARISYNTEFRTQHLPAFKQAVSSISDGDWFAAGLLKELIEKDEIPRVYGWGQPLHLYLASADDAAMLRLTCGDSIDRFERVRKP